LASELYAVFAFHKVELEIETEERLPTDSLRAARMKLRDALYHLRELELPYDVQRIFPWTLGFIGTRANREWLVTLADDDLHEQVLANWKSDSMGDRSFSYWQVDIVAVCEAHHRSWESSLRRFLQPSGLDLALRAKPALKKLYNRLSGFKWHQVHSEDDRNLQRLQDILLEFGMEIERPRGEGRVRIRKRASD
jgi:hypothetical protein